MSNKYNIAMTGVFCGFLAAVLGLSIILPDKTFSELENRNLSTVPELSVENLTNGDYSLTLNVEAGPLTQLGQSQAPITTFTEDFTVTVRNLKVSAGAGFIVALTGDIMTMPGLPKVPAAEKIDVDENGKITGLF